MTTRRKQLSEAMKASIRDAAAALFAEKGYPSVTMRDIARAAGCSHTAIYLYFNSKEDLLQQIAIPSLMQLEQRLLEKLEKRDTAPEDRLLAVCEQYVVFCLTSGSLQTVLFMSGSVRVDDPAPALEVNVIRNRLFAHISGMLHETVSGPREFASTEAEADAVNNGRVLFYYLQGFISTYTGHVEPTEQLLERTLPVLRHGIMTLVRGMKKY
ncbi:TetR/AcrR family transcriptional regulator [Paenibacillus silvisoli]|uniref:TetR/AcrR family transcriptional regulator n=1 Tax=Paenibacillus silvisoli TaxID=3110539 RepID=UPI00280451AD|nr:TetR/AcrR family transcriptional regulator [Paenibacillus silvisoli]